MPSRRFCNTWPPWVVAPRWPMYPCTASITTLSRWRRCGHQEGHEIRNARPADAEAAEPPRPGEPLRCQRHALQDGDIAVLDKAAVGVVHIRSAQNSDRERVAHTWAWHARVRHEQCELTNARVGRIRRLVIDEERAGEYRARG